MPPSKRKKPKRKPAAESEPEEPIPAPSPSPSPSHSPLDGQDMPSGWELLEQSDAERPDEAFDCFDLDQHAKKKTKHQKKADKKRREENIRELEARRKAGLIAPRTAPEFEQLVMSSPNSSYVWIQFMAYLIAQGELEKARATAQRALKTIQFREQDEKFNVYMAWLNAENAYGTEESTDEVFKKAMANSSQSKVLKTALDIYETTGKVERAREVSKSLCKLYSDNPESWIRVIRFHLRQGDAEQAKVHYRKSQQALHRRHHVHMSQQAALLEFKLGDPERGRSLMEQLLQNHPKRLDLWNVYCDQEVKYGEPNRTRALYERCTHLELKPKSMKAVFKRYLEYAKKIADDELIEHVKQQAMEYVQRLQAKVGDGDDDEDY